MWHQSIHKMAAECTIAKITALMCDWKKKCVVCCDLQVMGCIISVIRLVQTYFINRTQSVIIDGHESNPHTPMEGVPQGAVIGPLSFTLYSLPLESIIESHGIGKMIFADVAWYLQYPFSVDYQTNWLLNFSAFRTQLPDLIHLLNLVIIFHLF